MTFMAIFPVSGLLNGLLFVEYKLFHADSFGPERVFQLLVRFVCAREVCVPHKKAFAVVIGVHEPAGNIVRAVGAHLARGWVVYIHALDLDDNSAVFLRQYLSGLFVQRFNVLLVLALPDRLGVERRVAGVEDGLWRFLVILSIRAVY